jgi:hypothetical protein
VHNIFGADQPDYDIKCTSSLGLQARARLIKDLPLGVFAGEKLQPKVSTVYCMLFTRSAWQKDFYERRVVHTSRKPDFFCT